MKKLISLIAILLVFVGCSTQNLEYGLEPNSPLGEFYRHANISAMADAIDSNMEVMKEGANFMFSIMPKQCREQQDKLVDKMVSLAKEFINDELVNGIMVEGMKTLGDENIAIINELFKSDLGVRLESFLKKNKTTLFNIDDSMYDESFSKADNDKFNNEIKSNIKVDVEMANAMADIRGKLKNPNLFEDLRSKVLSGVKDEMAALQTCYMNNE